MAEVGRLPHESLAGLFLSFEADASGYIHAAFLWDQSRKLVGESKKLLDLVVISELLQLRR